MKIKWLGHSSFLITSEGGTKIITDPYSVGRGISYREIRESADIATISHDHSDHNNVAAVQGSPDVVRETGVREVKGVTFKGISSSHGFLRGTNIIFSFAVDGVKLCHLGDLAHLLTQEQVSAVGEVDVLFVPVGGLFTINASKAERVCDQLKPRVVFPMHFKNPKCSFPFASVDKFLKGREKCRRLETCEVEFSKASLPDAEETLVLESAL